MERRVKAIANGTGLKTRSNLDSMVGIVRLRLLSLKYV